METKADDGKEEESDDEQQFEIDGIIDQKRMEDGLYYLVKWCGYDDSNNTWIHWKQVNRTARSIWREKGRLAKFKKK